MVKVTGNPTWLPVVAVALTRPDGCLLLQQRPAHKHHGGLWEFPGGKVENGENPRAALCRELAEELAISLAADSLHPLAFAEEGDDPAIVLFLYTSTNFSATVVPQEAQAIAWLAPEEAADLPMAPMDRVLLQRWLAMRDLAQAPCQAEKATL